MSSMPCLFVSALSLNMSSEAVRVFIQPRAEGSSPVTVTITPSEEVEDRKRKRRKEQLAIGLAVAKGGLKVASYATHAGFEVSKFWTRFGFGIGRRTLQISATSLEAVGMEPGVLHLVDATVGVAEAITVTSLGLSQKITCGSLAATDTAVGLAQSQLAGDVEMAGMLIRLLPVEAEAAQAMSAVLAMIVDFAGPVQGVTLTQLKQAAVALAVVQHCSERPPPPTPSAHQHEETDLPHWMRCASAAYGSLFLKALGLLPALPSTSNTEAACAHTGLDLDDIILSEWQPSLYQPAFFLAIDHQRKAVVLSVSGSASVQDALTDLMCLPTAFLDGHAHHGMLRAARQLEEGLQETIQLQMALHPGYQLVLTGHSLGAGTVSLLAVLWQQVFPGLRCIAFATPAVLSMHLAEAAATHTTTVVVGHDMVPRFGHGTACDLRDALLAMVERPAVCDRICEMQYISYDDHQWCQSLMSELRALMQHDKLYPPGAIIWINPTASLDPSHSRCIAAHASDFNELLLSGSMVSSHLPHAYEHAIQSAECRSSL